MHQLPHLYPRVERQSGVPQVDGDELGGALQADRMTWSGSRGNAERGYKGWI
jgi:hypothetical protein